VEKLKGSEVWKFGERCVYCGYIIGASEDAYVIAGRPLHASCVEKLLAMPEGEFAKRAEGLPQPVREVLAKLRHGTLLPITQILPQAPAAGPGDEVREKIIEFRGILSTIFHGVEEHDWARLKLPEFQKVLDELESVVKELVEKGLLPRDWVEDDLIALREGIKEENAERALWAIADLLFWLLTRLFPSRESPREGTPKSEETPPEAELPETVILTREARAALWSRAKLIVSASLKAAEVRYVGEMRIDGMSPPHYSKFLFTIRDEIGKLLKEPKNVEFRVHTYMKGYADTDIFVGGEYFGTWRPPDPYIGAFWNWVHRIYNLLKYLGERGLLKEEVIKPRK
jgi:hypothetical protein